MCPFKKQHPTHTQHNKLHVNMHEKLCKLVKRSQLSEQHEFVNVSFPTQLYVGILQQVTSAVVIISNVCKCKTSNMDDLLQIPNGKRNGNQHYLADRYVHLSGSGWQLQ